MQNSELGLANAVTEATSKAVAAAPFPAQDLKGSLIIYCAGCMLEVNRGGKMPKVAELGLDTKALSQEVLDTFLLQLMTTGVLHCDPHPGNMCVTLNGTIVLYDFGMMDTLPPETVAGMRKIAFGLLNGSPDPTAKEITTYRSAASNPHAQPPRAARDASW